jgi:hypothetical protein
MRPFTRLLALACLSGLSIGPALAADGSAPATRPAAPAALPTADDIQALADAGRHRDVIKAVSRVVTLRGDEATRYDRPRMLMLKADAHLALKERQPALVTLELARKEANERADVRAEAKAMAMAALIRKSADGKYVPRTGDDHTGIEIADPETRREAVRALYRDERAAFGQAVAEAKTELDLPSITELTDQFLIVQALELAVTGKHEEGDEAANKLAHWINQLLDHSLDGFSKNLKRINAQTKGKRDLSTADAKLLANIRSTCDELPRTLERVNRAIARPNMLNVQERSARAAGLRDRAKALLERED